MFKAFIISIHLLMLSGLISYASAKNWQKVSDENEVRVYEHTQHIDMHVTVQHLFHPKVELKNEKIPEVLNNLTEQKKKTLALIGIKDWKINSHLLADDHRTLIIHGSYTDFKNIQQSFREEYHYQPDGSVQVLFAWPAASKNVESLLTSFKQEHPKEFVHD